MKTNLLLALSIVALYSTACSSLKGRLPPDEKFISSVRTQIKTQSPVPNLHDLSQKEKWTHDWFLAEAQKNCSLYENLSKIENFPLKLMASQRAKLLCLTKENAEEFLNTAKPAEAWLKKDFYEYAYQKAKEFKLSNQSYTLGKELVRYRASIPEKVELYKEVLEQVKGDKSNEAKVLEALARLSPSEFKEKSTDELTVAKDLEKKREFNKARKLYYKIIKDKKTLFADKLKAYERVRQCYRIERDDEMFLKKTDEMIAYLRKRHKEVPQSEEYLEALIATIVKKARLHWNRHETKFAEEILLETLDYENISNTQLSEVYYVLGQINLELKEPVTALGYLALAKDVPSKDAAFKDKLGWIVAWTNFDVLSNYDEAIKAFENLEKETKERFLLLQTRFWRAKAYRAKGDVKTADELLKNLASDDPYGYYGILAHKELGLKLKKLDPSNYPETPFFDTLEWLIAFGEMDSAQAFVADQMSKAKEKEQMESLLPLYLKVGKFADAMENFYKWEVTERNDALERLAPIFFPRPFEEIVKERSQKSGITKELIYSIMRQESSFNRFARSPSDAYGLMQLIPETAKQTSKEYKIPYKNIKDLFTPETNIALGSAYLSKMKKRFNSLPMTVASYNAGPIAVGGWMGKHKGDDLRYVEQIPYAETQKYVKLVFRNMVNYLRLSSDEDVALKDNPFEISY